MKNVSTLNTYIAVSLFVWKESSGIKSSGRIYTCSRSANLKLHLDVDYATAKREMARLMARTYRMPEIIGKNDEDSEMVMYTLTAFLD